MKFIIVELYKQKINIIEIFIKIFKVIERTYNIKVYRVKINKKFFTNIIKEYFKEKEIIIELIASYYYY